MKSRRTLQYRPHIKWFYHALMAAAAGIFILAVLGAGIVGYYNGTDSALNVFCVGPIFPVIYFLNAFFLFRPFAFSKLTVSGEGFQLVELGRTHSFTYDEIEKIDFSYARNAFGWFRLTLKSGKRFWFTSVLERSDYLLEMIASHKPDIAPLDRIEAYRREAIVVDHSWARFHENLGNWRTTGLKHTVYPVGLSVLWLSVHARSAGHLTLPSMDRVFATLVCAAILNTLVGLLCWTGAEFVIMSKERRALQKDPNQVLRLKANESGTVKLMALYHYVITAVCFVVWSFPRDRITSMSAG